ncbi:hypothetical protein [Streptomyces lunalinharesii]|uniref:Nucleopolyhedrovirus P10 family protein n=1 Tax=Streptomyces lunalinharesii TaxID=333384 RepID=A0ABN3RB70_9ACTN
MAANALARAVREQLGIGRVLPLGDPADGAWITERAARAALLRAPGIPPGVRLDALRLALAAPDEAPAPTVPAPPGALPPGPLRLAVHLAAPPGLPLPPLAERLRTALLATAEDGLGLRVRAVDLHVDALLDEAAAPTAQPPGTPAAQEDRGDAPEPAGAKAPDDLASRVRAVPGVAGLAPALAGRSAAVSRSDDGHHVLVQVATAAGHRALDVARAVRRTVTGPPPAPATAAVLVTEVAAV